MNRPPLQCAKARSGGAALVMAAMMVACDSGGMSSDEVRTAAMEKAREEFNLADNAPLEAAVWTGTEYDGEGSVCGTVSSAGGRMPPQRFLARLEPFEWLVFEGAHERMIQSQPDKFAEWERYCAASRG